MRYEHQAKEYLSEKLGDAFVPGPWFRFQSRAVAGAQTQLLWCQPDGLYFDFRLGRITIIEIKLRHTSDAWYQVRRLYQPVVQRVFGALWDYTVVEVARWFDPATPFPEHIRMLPNVAEAPLEMFSVHRWGKDEFAG